MRIGDLFLLLPPPHIWMHHLANDWSGPNDRYLNDYVVELLWSVARKRCHLCAALHLEHADGIRTLKCLIDLVILG